MNKCVIRHNDANNVSDHLALCMDMELIPQSDNSDKTDCNINPVPYLPRLNWQDTNYQRRYCELLKESLDQISRSTYNLSEINKGSAVVFVNNLYNVICSTIHDVTQKCANEFNERKTHGAKQWWTKECTLARNSSIFGNQLGALQRGLPTTATKRPGEITVVSVDRQLKRDTVISLIS